VFVNIVIAIIVLLGTLSGGLITAADHANPGDALFGLDLKMEELGLQLVKDPVRTKTLEEKYNQERLEEIQNMLDHYSALNAYNPTELDYCDGTAKVPHPIGSRLAEQLNVSYNDVMNWRCLGFGFGDIRIAYAISHYSGQTVTELFQMYALGLDWLDVTQTAALQGSDANIASLKNNTLLVPSTENETPSGIQEDTQKTTDNQSNIDSSLCTGEVIHTQGAAVAAEFGVFYEDVMAWYCEGYNFGEIKLAYSLRQQSGLSLEEIFSKRAAGQGWGAILKEFGLKNQPENPGKPIDKGKLEDEGKPEEKNNKDDQPVPPGQDKKNQ